MTAATHAATAPSAVDWSAAEAGDDAEASESGFFSAAGEPLADDFLSEPESESLEQPPRATTAASAAPVIELIRLAL